MMKSIQYIEKTALLALVLGSVAFLAAPSAIAREFRLQVINNTGSTIAVGLAGTETSDKTIIRPGSKSPTSDTISVDDTRSSSIYLYVNPNEVVRKASPNAEEYTVLACEAPFAIQGKMAKSLATVAKGSKKTYKLCDYSVNFCGTDLICITFGNATFKEAASIKFPPRHPGGGRAGHPPHHLPRAADTQR